MNEKGFGQHYSNKIMITSYSTQKKNDGQHIFYIRHFFFRVNTFFLKLHIFFITNKTVFFTSSFRNSLIRNNRLVETFDLNPKEFLISRFYCICKTGINKIINIDNINSKLVFIYIIDYGSLLYNLQVLHIKYTHSMDVILNTYYYILIPI